LDRYKGVFLPIGHYYESTIPSKIDFSFAIETESFLNQLYVTAIQSHELLEISPAILEALSVSSSISLSIQNKVFDAKFVKNIKALGRILITLDRQIENTISKGAHSRLAGDPTVDAPPPDVKKKKKPKR